MKHEMTIKQLLDAAGPVSRFVPAQTAELIMGLASAVRQLEAMNAAQLAVIESVRAVAAHSEGIAGWHQNGNIASWGEILPELEDNVSTSPQPDPIEERRRRNREANARARAKETPAQRASRQEKNRERMRKSRGGE